MKKVALSLSIIFLLLSGSLKSQNLNDSIVKLENIITRIHILPPGVSFEKYLVGNSTMLFDVGVGISYTWTESVLEPDIGFVPYIALEPRVYTNLQSRRKKSKRTDYHSGAYGAFRIQGGINIESERWYLQLGPLVGFQRTFGYHSYFNIGIGPGATVIFDEYTGFGLIGNLKLGFMFK